MSPASVACSRGLRVFGPAMRVESTATGCQPQAAAILGPVACSGARGSPGSPPGSPIASRHIPEDCRLSVVLDLDETLIHTHYQPQRPHDFEVMVPGRKAGSTVVAYIKKRPGVDAFLEWLHKENFDLSLYTAGTTAYATAILKVLDPERIISNRFCRDKCVKAPVPQVYWKDLKIVNKNLTRVVLVDNNPVCFHMQPDNGILIKDYFGEVEDKEWKDDHELERVQGLLIRLADTPGDVRKILRKELKQKDLRPLIKQAMEYHKQVSRL